MEITPEIQGALENDATMIATLCKAVKDRWGDEGIAVLRDAMEKKYSRIVPAAAKHIGARINDGIIEDWAKLEAHFGKSMGIEGESEVTRTRGVLRMRNCPYAKQYARIFPGTCPDVLIGCERAIARTVNPHLNVRGQKYITDGYDVCELVVEWDKDYQSK